MKNKDNSFSGNITTSDSQSTFEQQACFHCGEDCPDLDIHFDEKYFCCHGCQTVYELLNKTGLCTYYDLNENAGINRREIERTNKFAFLEEESIAASLIQFRDQGQAHVTFYIPLIHCSSCVYLLENLHRIEPGIVRADIQFLKKELRIIYDESKISLFSNQFIQKHWNKYIIRWLTPLFHKKNMGNIFLIGLLNGLLPCGLVYMAIAGALATGNILYSSLFMAAFGLGTLPAMVTMSFAGSFVSMSMRNKLKRSIPYIVGFMGILLILRGMNLNIPYISPALGATGTVEQCH